ncbi:MAG: hypothetical protein FWF69_04675 [Firmicutes bacterium]|nr:hypothetical protein [Bacillota bacterium]
MSIALLRQIEAAEARAAETLVRAQREARDILKTADEAGGTNERNAALEHRALTQRVLEDARATARRQIDELEKAEALEREKIIEAARERLPGAARVIFERIVNDGAR